MKEDIANDMKREVITDMKKGLSFMKISVLVMFVMSIIFTVAMIVIFIVKDSIPDTLVSSFFTFIGVEGGSMAIIKTVESYARKLKDIKQIEVDGKSLSEVVNDIVDIVEEDTSDSDIVDEE